jgi:hypothetical protein
MQLAMIACFGYVWPFDFAVKGSSWAMVRWLLYIVLVSLLYGANWAHALQVVDRDQFYVYFSDGQWEIATRLLEACEPIAGFLKIRGLPIKTPLHIVLDNELDQPTVRVSMIPHREIRIPVRAPGVLEDGFLESDPWRYFLFLGLCTQGIYSERSGIPADLHKVFGEIMSPNIILPDWGVEGIGNLLYSQYQNRDRSSPLARTIFNTTPIPDLDRVSNHPEIWPGRYSHRIYGRPFIDWLDRNFGWDRLLMVLRLHGASIVPIEIDSQARAVYGQSWSQLWRAFQKEHGVVGKGSAGLPIIGYWHDPFVYWNDMGVYPGLPQSGWRGRYGYVDGQGWLKTSEYDGQGVSRLKFMRNGIVLTAAGEHIWDPGPGAVAVTRRGHRPMLVLKAADRLYPWFEQPSQGMKQERLIEAPPGVIQLSGPVMDRKGHIAVAGNSGGNWDIWLHDGSWRRVTDTPSIEMDPWIQEDKLLFASNVTGRFQIHTLHMLQVTHAATAAVMPRHSSYLLLDAMGWRTESMHIEDLPALTGTVGSAPRAGPDKQAVQGRTQPYSPFKSLGTNYIVPDLFIDTDTLQVGLASEGTDVSGRYAWDAGVRYTLQDSIFSWRLGARIHDWHARATRYPFGYTTSRLTTVDEMRHEIKLGWRPLGSKLLEFSANWRYYAPESGHEPGQDEWWGSISYLHTFGSLRTQATFDLFTEGSQSLYGEAAYKFGEKISTSIRLQGGRTWGDWVPGHNTFRIGGNTGEGFFTQRPSRLFPLRGFDTNVLDAGKAAAGGIEILWPVARLQAGYQALPIFLRNITVGTFVDGGFATDHVTRDEILLSAGLEWITGMELAWGFLADLRIGLAWPLAYPDDIDQSGPVFLIQIGRPL